MLDLETAGAQTHMNKQEPPCVKNGWTPGLLHNALVSFLANCWR